MRIQHNIMAMNSYRNLGMNNSKLSKNLEKLSSGYRINRAGDDAAGLAISEKMRAQIAGLDQAQKNAQSGINLVQTAEGALTEVHDMLNRMVTLSTQAANGTYSEPDREKIQAEINALTDEIDRIADNSNFNGTKLLDGSLSGTGATTATKSITTDLKTYTVDATKGKFVSATLATPNAADGDSISFTVALDNGKSYTVDLTYTKPEGATNATLVDQDGNEYSYNPANATEVGEAVKSALTKKIGNEFTITNNSGALTFENKTAGANQTKVTSITSQKTTAGATQALAAVTVTETAGADAYSTMLSTEIVAYDGTNSKTATFEINGQKFVYTDDPALDLSKLDEDIHVIQGAVGDVDSDGDQIARALSQKLGMDVTYADPAVDVDGDGAEDDPGFMFKAGTSTSAKGGMNLQIGSSAVETINVSVDSMKAQALGIKGLDVSNEKLANQAIDTINAAIEKVSVQRGNLGAIQNRLEHTINNLGVMEENIQDAEANIRDTDIADEMMAYTKNNILIQSAQAMLAQANQVPQGVLQLMQ